MTFKESLKLILTGKRPIKDVWYYIQGNVRYTLWYWKSNYNYSSKYIRYIYLIPLHKLIPSYIREQIEYRIKWMNKECYNQGSCIKCGCQTTHLQMCNKACEGNCYPQMMTKSQWSRYNTFREISFDKNKCIVWIKQRKDGRPLLYIWKSKQNKYVLEN